MTVVGPAVRDLILGTAGHIDHGKTALVRALTGVNTDRLPEEKRRGITIDLGFTQLDLGEFRLGVVDVPGHERFIRNMLAGATGADLVLLVVSAAEAVRQQTREHLEICNLLGISAGVIALTKCDLVEPSWLPLVAAEVRELLAGTSLAAAEIIPTSAVTGEGLAELKSALHRAAERTPARWSPQQAGPSPPFRLPVDRSFTVAGQGTVVTGSVASGQVRVGGVLALEPGGIAVRVRGVQQHERPVEELHAGQRGAVNLTGVHHTQVVRGMELATAGYLQPSSRLTVRLQLLPTAPPLKSRSPVRVHLGTAELTGRVSLLEGPTLAPGSAAIAQLQLTAPAVATWGQPFIFRSESPPATLGGGRVLEPAPPSRKANTAPLAALGRLESADPSVRVAAFAELRGLETWSPADLPRETGVACPAALVAQLVTQGELLSVEPKPAQQLLVHRAVVCELGERCTRLLAAWHDREPLRSGFPTADLFAALAPAPPVLVELALTQLATEKKLQRWPGALAVEGRGPKLSRNEQKLLEELLTRFAAAGLEAPALADCRAFAGTLGARVQALLELAVADGRLVKVTPDYYVAAGVEARARVRLAERLANGPLTVGEVRELLGISRKFAVPLCEYWDRTGFTQRQGDLRVLAAAPSENLG